MIPHLVSSESAPVLELEQRILEAQPSIERWFRLEWMEHSPPFYGSVDLRNGGFKLAPVDTNLFPGGWNNLSADMIPLAVQAAMAAIEKICPEAKGLLLIPERHTRNSFYLENLGRLTQIFHQAGLNVHVGTVDDAIAEPTRVPLPDGSSLLLEPLVRDRRRLGTKDFDPCTILLNNDLSSGVPPSLEGLHEQYLLPPLHAGWKTRRKSAHFRSYDAVVKRFAKLIGVDPWMLNPYFTQCGGIDFQQRQGEEELAEAVDQVLTKVRKKYKEYGIHDKPFVAVKADAGTYGMGVMMVHDAAEMKDLNRRTRNKMSVVKEGMQVRDVIIQEGVPSIERLQEAVCEPVVYMMDRYVVGGFYRVHADRGPAENLNSPGMHFVPLAFDEQFNVTNPDAKPGTSGPNRFYMYGVIARLALVAASYELEATDPESEAG